MVKFLMQGKKEFVHLYHNFLTEFFALFNLRKKEKKLEIQLFRSVFVNSSIEILNRKFIIWKNGARQCKDLEKVICNEEYVTNIEPYLRKFNYYSKSKML